MSNPDLDPKRTPRLRRGPRPACACDLPSCRACRIAATRRRWYKRNAERVKSQTKEALKLWRAKQHATEISDAELDRRALEKWDSSWGARA